jgi:3-oxoacyl-[acyl-carrier protein] reductase
MFDLTGMTALVTGASGGIGSAIAKALAARGARVALSGTRAEALAAVAAECGPDAVILPCNLSDSAAVDALVPQAVEALGGRLDILVANAGITRDNLAMRMKDDEWADVIRINLEATFRLYRAAAKPMMKQRFGRMIAITSVVGVTGNPGQANYAASKAGAMSLARTLGVAWAPEGIRVNGMAPGLVDTKLTKITSQHPKRLEGALASIPMHRLGTPADMAGAVLFLLSDAARFVTGTVLPVDGGYAVA